MRSALECRQQAEKCETKAKGSVDGVHRRLLFGLADQWRALATAAENHAHAIELIQLSRIVLRGTKPRHP